MKPSYINYPGLGLGFIRRITRPLTTIGIVSTGEHLIVPTSSIKELLIRQTIKINQIGSVKLYEYIKVRTPHESYVLQLLRIPEDNDDGCTFAKFWKDPDTGNYRNGVLVLDSNDFFSATRDIMTLRRLSKLPNWMAGRKNTPLTQFKTIRES